MLFWNALICSALHRLLVRVVVSCNEIRCALTSCFAVDTPTELEENEAD